jgi:hypothetical protein
MKKLILEANVINEVFKLEFLSITVEHFKHRAFI